MSEEKKRFSEMTTDEKIKHLKEANEELQGAIDKYERLIDIKRKRIKKNEAIIKKFSSNEYIEKEQRKAQKKNDKEILELIQKMGISKEQLEAVLTKNK